MGASEIKVFGQELYFEESIRAIESFAGLHNHDHLTGRIAELLPHPSESTRKRVASKIVQRFFSSHDSCDAVFPLLVAGLKSDQARRDLLFWRTSRTDRLIAAIADEVFYPYFTLNTLPEGFDEASFNMANTGTLFTVDRMISRDFVVRYAKSAWNFDSARTIGLALRIMKQAQILDSIYVKVGRRHVLSYYPQPHPVQPEVFAYCIHEELLDQESVPMPSLDRIQSAECVRLFMLNRLQVDGLLKALEKQKVIEFITMPGGRHIRFTDPDLKTLAGRFVTLHPS